MNKYKELFLTGFNVGNLCDELLDFIPKEIAFNFIKEKFKEEYKPQDVLELCNECGYSNKEVKIEIIADLFDLYWEESEKLVSKYN